jgi:precorrin-2 C20-methyltransferase/precorrin-3B C17-methyltransferase
MTGRLRVVGLGPGRADWCTPHVAELLTEATDLVGYRAYLEQIPVSVTGRRHASGNRVEAPRAALALDLAAEGRDVVVVSSGDPGVFAMAAAIVEQLDERPDRWCEIEVEVVPGITAAQAVASRVGAPLGHDHCVISLSDVRKPWSVIEQRLDAAAGADFVLALYNPRSRHRPDQLAAALDVIGRHRAPTTPVIVGRHVGRSEERVSVTTLADLDPTIVDMSTILLVGSSTTRVLDRPLGASVYTPRTHLPRTGAPEAAPTPGW